MKFYALLSAQGTACAETVLREDEYNERNREAVERAAARMTGDDRPVLGTWTDVSDNEACRDMYRSDEETDAPAP